MSDSIKKFARKHKYKLIIGGIAVALMGIFLAFFVSPSFLAMIILSFIWTGYFYFLGTEQPLNKNKTNDIQNCKQSKNKLQVSKDIKLENALQLPEHQPQKQENVIVNGNDNIQESKVDSPCVPITEELVYGYISEMITIGWDASLGQESQLVTTRDGISRPEIPIYCVLTLHFQKIRWQTYSLDQIIFDVKSIIGILTDTAINDIDEYLNRYLENPTNDNDSTNIRLITTENVEEQLKEFDHRGGRSIRIKDLDNLIKKIESRYQAAINKLENPSPNIEVAPQLNDIK